MMKLNVVHPYIPNSVPSVKKEMLNKLGMKSVEDIFKEIPEHLRFKGKMNLPEPLLSEYDLQRHVEGILSKNKSCKEYVNYLGSGIWQHHVPAVCDTIASRDEFLTAYVGDTYSDHGKFQALFETASMIGDLTGFDACNTPTYDWANSVAIACRMASRTTGKNIILFAGNISPGRRLVIENYCKPDLTVVSIDFNKDTGEMDLSDLKCKLSEKVAAVYYENPGYFGFIETNAREIIEITQKNGSLSIVGVDPTSLGILEAPGEMGADYAVGDFQPLGLHMSWGGGLGGFIATRDEKEFLGEYPSLLFGLTETIKEGEYGFGEVFYERTSYASREKGKDFIGTCAALHGIVAGVYLALMGPQGMHELGEGILQRVAYAKKLIEAIPGVNMPLKGYTFKEFIINFDEIGRNVEEINKELLNYKIFGGKDISTEYPIYGNSAVYCITEIHTKEDIEQLAQALTAICIK
jgi:glycine dehydrogenase subunit 1